MKSVFVKGAITLLGAALLAGCVGVYDHRGAVIDQELASAIQIGVDNKESVRKDIGPANVCRSVHA